MHRKTAGDGCCTRWLPRASGRWFGVNETLRDNRGRDIWMRVTGEKGIIQIRKERVVHVVAMESS